MSARRFDDALRDELIDSFRRGVEHCTEAEVKLAADVLWEIVVALPAEAPRSVDQVLQRAHRVILAEYAQQRALRHSGNALQDDGTPTPTIGERTPADLEAELARAVAEIDHRLQGDTP